MRRRQTYSSKTERGDTDMSSFDEEEGFSDSLDEEEVTTLDVQQRKLAAYRRDLMKVVKLKTHVLSATVKGETESVGVRLSLSLSFEKERREFSSPRHCRAGCRCVSVTCSKDGREIEWYRGQSGGDGKHKPAGAIPTDKASSSRLVATDGRKGEVCEMSVCF